MASPSPTPLVLSSAENNPLCLRKAPGSRVRAEARGHPGEHKRERRRKPAVMTNSVLTKTSSERIFFFPFSNWNFVNPGDR